MSAPGLLVVAVDGVLADTLPSRLACFLIGAEAAGMSAPDPTGDAALTPDWIAGRSWPNAARRLAADLALGRAGGIRPDEVAIDLCAMAAEQEWTRRLSLGLPDIGTDAVWRCEAAVSSGWRLVLRADSTRRSAGSLFSYLENETHAVRTVAGDDPGVLDLLSEKPLFMSQYAGIVASLKRYSASSEQSINVVETSSIQARADAAMGRFLAAGWP